MRREASPTRGAFLKRSRGWTLRIPLVPAVAGAARMDCRDKRWSCGSLSSTSRMISRRAGPQILLPLCLHVGQGCAVGCFRSDSGDWGDDNGNIPTLLPLSEGLMTGRGGGRRWSALPLTFLGQQHCVKRLCNLFLN